MKQQLILILLGAAVLAGCASNDVDPNRTAHDEQMRLLQIERYKFAEVLASKCQSDLCVVNVVEKSGVSDPLPAYKPPQSAWVAVTGTLGDTAQAYFKGETLKSLANIGGDIVTTALNRAPTDNSTHYDVDGNLGDTDNSYTVGGNLGDTDESVAYGDGATIGDANTVGDNNGDGNRIGGDDNSGNSGRIDSPGPFDNDVDNSDNSIDNPPPVDDGDGG